MSYVWEEELMSNHGVPTVWQVQHHQEYRANNRQRMKAYNAEMYAARKDAEKQRCAEYFQQNKAARASYVAKRRASRLNATPQWADAALIKLLYATRQYLSQETGEDWHVDHIVPLQGRTVCGLHVHFNLRVVPAKFNLRKGAIHADQSEQTF